MRSRLVLLGAATLRHRLELVLTAWATVTADLYPLFRLGDCAVLLGVTSLTFVTWLRLCSITDTVNLPSMTSRWEDGNEHTRRRLRD